MNPILARLDAYEKLIRLDRPIGILLLLWPTLWGLWLASHLCDLVQIRTLPEGTVVRLHHEAPTQLTPARRTGRSLKRSVAMAAEFTSAATSVASWPAKHR